MNASDRTVILEALHEAEVEVETRFTELSDDAEGEPNMLTRNAEGTLGKIRRAIKTLEKQEK